jgi:hypothetical protein
VEKTNTGLSDSLGSTSALADATGTIHTQYTYEPFGAMTQLGASTTNSFVYTGREYDTAELGNMDNVNQNENPVRLGLGEPARTAY